MEPRFYLRGLLGRTGLQSGLCRLLWGQGQVREGRQATNSETRRLLALQEKVERNAQAITRLKTVWSFLAAGIAFLAAALKDWLFGTK